LELHGKNLIGGARSSEGDRTFRATDPSTGAALDPAFHAATPAEADRAAEAAARAFAAYRRVPAAGIAAFLEKVAAAIGDVGDALIDRAAAESGLTKDRLTGERGRTVNQLRMFATLVAEGSWVDARIDRAQPDRKPLPKPDLRRVLQPIGPVLVFGASNFPLAFSVAGGDTASALAAGCPIIVKAHSAHPGTSELVGMAVQKAAREAGMPDGVFSLIHGSGAVVGQRLATHPAVRAVGFTGSREAGRALFDAAARRPDPIPVYAEMASVNPVFILPRALRERADAIAEGLKGSVTLGYGQFCTKPGLVFGLRGGDLDAFTGKFGALMSRVPPGTLLHRGILETYEAGVRTLSGATGVRSGGRSEAAADSGKTQAQANVFLTDAETFLRDPAIREEVFGPSTVVVACPSREDFLRAAREMEGHLTATLHGTEEDLRESAELVALLETKVGRLVFNGYPTGVEVCPSMHHGGPYPATTDPHFTSVGTAAIGRWARPVCYQNCPQELLPAELRNRNERGLWRLVDGKLSREDV
jgi:NADP-dependent aldehyde dehydrogenase